MVPGQQNFESLNIRDFIKKALEEDVGDGDHTSLACIPENASGKAIVKVKDRGVIAGLVLADQILNYIDPTIIVKVLTTDGSLVMQDEIVMEVNGNIRSMLKAERLLLNCMQRMSGIATLTRKVVDEVKGTNTKILDTRKTTPNFRLFEKWAVHLGGGFNHRFGLYDMVLIKDNHVDACGGISEAIKRVNDYLKKKNKNLAVEIETRTLDEVAEVISCGGIHRIMFDNFTPGQLKEAVSLVNGKFETEASGGITLENIREFAEMGVDYISVGALTHSYKSMDISFKIVS
jgi:nicotinate-nucleotide pyrophosphorylase (carboxylating)